MIEYRSGDGNNFKPVRSILRNNFFDRFVSTHDRHAYVHEYDMRFKFIQALQSFLAISNLQGFYSDTLENGGQQLSIDFDIVYDQRFNTRPL